MVKIIGSIDNAYIFNTAYHLVFTEREMLQFMIKKGKEERKEIFNAEMSNPTRMVPVYGRVTEYGAMRNVVMDMIGENIDIGLKIEANLEDLVRESPPKYTSVDYAEVVSARLSGGNLFSLPRVIIRTADKKRKFRLLHGNYQGRGKLSDKVFSDYESILRKVFAEKLTVKP